jgi:hypothetical protein
LRNVREGLARLAESRNPNAAIPQKVSRPQLIRFLRREIAAVFRMEYEVEDLLALFREHGVDLNARTFREYWRQACKKKTAEEMPDPTHD